MSARNTDSGRDLQVIVGLPSWELGGVSTFSANLVRGLNARRIAAHVLVTEQSCDLVSIAGMSIPGPADVPTALLPVEQPDSWGNHWAAMIRYLEDRGPCIYIPNHDWRHSCISPRLSRQVSVVGVVHSDDPLHYDHVARLGRFWDAIVTVSPTLQRKVTQLQPELRARISTIPIGVPVPTNPPVQAGGRGEPLRIIYHGVLSQHQKRILDLPAIMAGLMARGVAVELTVAGGGADETRLRAAFGNLVERGVVRFTGVLPHQRVLTLLDDQDVYVMTSEFEGMPNALLEAMGRGCVPVVTRVESGIPDIVADGRNGFCVPIGDIGAFIERLSLLASDHARRATMASAARQTVTHGGHTVDDMVDRYVELFDRLRCATGTSQFRRPRAELRPPPTAVGEQSILPGDYWEDMKRLEFELRWAHLPPPLFAAGRHGTASVARFGRLVRRYVS